MIKNILTNLVLHSPEDGKSGYSKERGDEIIAKVQKEEKLTAETAIEVFDFLINAEHKVDFFTNVRPKLSSSIIAGLAEGNPDLQNKLYEFNNTNIQNADIKAIQAKYKSNGIGTQSAAMPEATKKSAEEIHRDLTNPGTSKEDFADSFNQAKNLKADTDVGATQETLQTLTPDARAPLGSEVRKERMDELDAITKNAESNPGSSVKDRVAKLNADAAKGNTKPTFTGDPKSRTPSPKPEDFGIIPGNVTEKVNKLQGNKGDSGSGGSPTPQPAPGPANNPLPPQTQNNPNSLPGQNLGLDDIPQGIVKQRREELDGSSAGGDSGSGGNPTPQPAPGPANNPLPPLAQNNPNPAPGQNLGLDDIPKGIVGKRLKELGKSATSGNPVGSDGYGALPFPPNNPAAAPGEAGIGEGEDDANEQDIINNSTGGDDTESRKKRGFFGDFFSVANKGQFAATFLLTGIALFAFPPAVPFFVTLLALQVVAQVAEKVLPVVFMAATALVAIAETVKNIPNITMNLVKGLGQILTLGYYKPKYSEINYDATKASFSTLFNKDIDKGKDKDKDKDDTKEKGTNYSKAIGTAFAKAFAAVIGLPLAFVANIIGNTIMGVVNVVLLFTFFLPSKALPPKFQMRLAPLNFDFTRNFVSNYITGNKDAAIARNEARKAEAKEQYMERKAKYEEKQQQKGLSSSAAQGLGTQSPALNAAAKSFSEEQKQTKALRKNIADLDKNIKSQKQELDKIDQKIQKEQDPNKKAALIAQRAKIAGKLEQNIDSKRENQYKAQRYLETTDPSKSRFRDADRRGEQLSTKDKITTLDNSIKFQNKQLEKIKDEIKNEQNPKTKAELQQQKKDIEYIIRRDEQLKSEYEIASGNNAAQQGHGKRNRGNALVTPPGQNTIPAPGEIGPPPPPPVPSPPPPPPAGAVPHGAPPSEQGTPVPASSRQSVDEKYQAMTPPPGAAAPPPSSPGSGQGNTPSHYDQTPSASAEELDDFDLLVKEDKERKAAERKAAAASTPSHYDQTPSASAEELDDFDLLVKEGKERKAAAASTPPPPPPPPPYPGTDPKDQAAKSNAQQQVDQQVESMKGSISTDSDDKTADDNKKPNKTPKNPSMTRGGGNTSVTL